MCDKYCVITAKLPEFANATSGRGGILYHIVIDPRQ